MKTKKFSAGKLIGSCVIIPSLNINWLQFTEGIKYYIQLAWGRWYVQYTFSKGKTY